MNDYKALNEYFSDSEVANRRKASRSIETLRSKCIKNIPVGDGIPLNLKLFPLKINDEYKLDFRLQQTPQKSSRSRLKFYSVLKAFENSDESLGNNRNEFIKAMGNKKQAVENKPTSPSQLLKRTTIVSEIHRDEVAPSEESIMESVFDGMAGGQQVDTDYEQFMSDSLNSMLAWKDSQIHRLSVASSYEYHKRMMRKKKNPKTGYSSNDVFFTSRTVSTITSLDEQKSTSCFGRLFCPILKIKRQKFTY